MRECQLSLQYLSSVADYDTLVVVIHLLPLEVIDDLTFRLSGHDRLNACIQRADELHLVDVAIGISDGESQDLLTLCQVLGQITCHHLVGTPCTCRCYGNLTHLCDGCSLHRADGEAAI